jgi:SAM-dependent methyltransferase
MAKPVDDSIARTAPVLTKSKQRIADHGEVYTAPREVNAMLDLVKQETERIESRFLEPACGNGNFLIEVLARKLAKITARYGKSRLEYERYAVAAIASLYGIDILEDNVLECRSRLCNYFTTQYINRFGLFPNDDLPATVTYILNLNIVWGDALKLQTVGDNPKPIVFPEWSLLMGGMVKRRDFSFFELLYQSENNSMPLFSDTGEDVFIPKPEKEFPPVHYLKIWDMENLKTREAAAW